MAEICAETAAYLLEGSIDRTLLFGPVVWLPSDGPSARQWCFIVVGCDRIGETRHDQLNAETESAPWRSGLASWRRSSSSGPASCTISTTNWRWRGWPKLHGRARSVTTASSGTTRETYAAIAFVSSPVRPYVTVPSVI
jgi:hypothetical protein